MNIITETTNCLFLVKKKKKNIYKWYPNKLLLQMYIQIYIICIYTLLAVCK